MQTNDYSLVEIIIWSHMIIIIIIIWFEYMKPENCVHIICIRLEFFKLYNHCTKTFKKNLYQKGIYKNSINEISLLLGINWHETIWYVSKINE